MCKHMNDQFCLNLFKKKKLNLRNAILNQTFMNCFNFWYLVQSIIYLVIHD